MYGGLTAGMGFLPPDLDDRSHEAWFDFVVDRYKLQGKTIEECREKMVMLMDAAAKRAKLRKEGLAE